MFPAAAPLAPAPATSTESSFRGLGEEAKIVSWPLPFIVCYGGELAMMLEELISAADAEFGLSGKLLSCSLIAEKPTRVPSLCKYAVRLFLRSGDSRILKLYPVQFRAEQALYERRCLFAERLLSNRILTARPEKSAQGYTRLLQYDGQYWVALIEEDIGTDIVHISPGDPAWIRLLAKTHAVSKKECFRIGQSSSWYNIFSKNEIVRYDKYASIVLKLADTKYGSQAKYILSAGKVLMEKVFSLLSEFDEYATQGDFAPSNLFWRSADLGIMDYDEAGDCTLLSDLVLQCYHYARGVLHINSKTELDACMMLSKEEYASVLPLCPEEEEVYWRIYQLAQIFDYEEMRLLSNSFKTPDTFTKDAETVLNRMEAKIGDVSLL